MSVLLDTNVLSEFLRARPDSAVLAWVAAQPANSMFVSTVTQAEMMLGARLLPAG
jgi:predicted nucleic acid-binding protein